MLALGSSALTEGFALIGFETVPDATAEDLEAVLAELVRGNQRAMVIVERTLARGNWALAQSGAERRWAYCPGRGARVECAIQLPPISRGSGREHSWPTGP